MSALSRVDPALAQGALLAGLAVVVGAVTAFWLRTRLPASVVVVVLAAAGAALAWGGLLRVHADRPEYLFAVPVMAALVPIHVRIVLGPFGKR